MTEPVEVARAVVDAHREWATVLAATARVARDLDLAEECVQDAYAAALVAWVRDGIPRRPVAWLTTAARRRATDEVRRARSLRSKLPLLVVPEDEPGSTVDADEPGAGDPDDVVPDERLRLILMCCHPALGQEARIALTLRLVCGMATADIARVFLVSEAAMSARLTRAKRKIAAARIPFQVPGAAQLPDRLRAVLNVIHLLFTVGHTGPSGDALTRVDLVDQAVRLARVLRDLMPDEPEVRGLLALLLVTDARRATRLGPDGRLLRLAEQDRSRWDWAAIAEARALLADDSPGGRPGRFALQAAIAARYAEAPTYDQTDWAAIVRLYDDLRAVWPSPVVDLNRAVALSRAAGPGPALAVVDELERDGRLAGYHYLPAVKADLLRQLGAADQAAAAYRRALELAGNEVERAFLAERLAELGRP